MATTLGGTTLAEPAYGHDGCIRTVVDVVAQHELLSGDLAVDYTGYRWRWSLRWQGITTTERNTIRGKYLVRTTQTFSPPDTATEYTVLVVPNSWRDSYIEGGDGTQYWDCEMEVEKSAAAAY